MAEQVVIVINLRSRGPAHGISIWARKGGRAALVIDPAFIALGTGQIRIEQYGRRRYAVGSVVADHVLLRREGCRMNSRSPVLVSLVAARGEHLSHVQARVVQYDGCGGYPSRARSYPLG